MDERPVSSLQEGDYTKYGKVVRVHAHDDCYHITYKFVAMGNTHYQQITHHASEVIQ